MIVFKYIGYGVGALVLSALAACGGGGGASAATGTNGGTSNSSSRPSMVPAPLARTDTTPLYTDVGRLRPVANNGVWLYQGTFTSTGSPVQTYQDSVTQTLRSDGTYTESATNLLGGGSSVGQLQFDGMAVKSTVHDFNDQPLSSLVPELTAPVFKNDQFTIQETTLADSGADVDNDGRHDAVDVAIYRRVIGNETVNPPSLGSVTALHVDTVYNVRFIASSNQVASPVVSIVQSTWYVTDIGIVQQSLTVPAANGGSETWSEVLTSYNGVGSGAGM